MCALKTIRELCDAGAKAHGAGDPLNGDFLLQQAYAQARGLNSPVLEAKILNTMGVFALEGKRAKKAVPLLSEAREKVRKRIGTQNKLYEVICSNLLQAQVASVTAG
ncbi:MAG: hypothetical protein DELT_01347 [Desulfovibrio sp.]